MNAPTTPTTVRLSGDEGLLSAIPAILGFHPTDSVVIACMQGTRNRLGPIIRIDLTDVLSAPIPLAVQMSGVMYRHADRAVLVFYGTDADPMRFAETLRTFGAPINGTLFVGNEPHHIDAALHAETVALGNVVQPTRECLRTRVEFDEKSSDEVDAVLASAMRDYASRDRFLATHMADARPALEQVLAMCRLTRDSKEDDSSMVLANMCAVAGLLAYRCGDGALAQVCLDRSLRVDPAHNLARMVIQVISVGIPPAELDHLMEGIR